MVVTRINYQIFPNWDIVLMFEMALALVVINVALAQCTKIQRFKSISFFLFTKLRTKHYVHEGEKSTQCPIHVSLSHFFSPLVRLLVRLSIGPICEQF